MLEQENTPESQARIENLNELMNAAAEAVERGETVRDFLDHAALVAQADAIDEASQITLMTIHNAKGLEFPVVFMAGMEDGLFPHSRSLLSEAAMEEERRLCYVGMTRAEKRLVLSLGEVPAALRRRRAGADHGVAVPERNSVEPGDQPRRRKRMTVPQVDLTAERWQVRQDSRKNLYTGKTYNSVENVAQFFKERGVNVPIRGYPDTATSPPVAKPVRPAPRPRRKVGCSEPCHRQSNRSRPLPKAPPLPKQPARTGTVVEHPKYGTGTDRPA